MNKLKNKTSGFTLIEMMVVIAVIGILSAAVLGGLAPARKRARDARVISGVNQIRAVIEANVDLSQNYPAFPDEAKNTAVDIFRNNDEGVFYAPSGRTFKLCAKLPSNGKYYCVNETGAVTQDANTAGGAAITGS